LFATHGQNLPREFGASIGERTYLHQVGAHGGAGRQFRECELTESDDAGEQVVEIVGDAASERTNGFKFLGLSQLLLALREGAFRRAAGRDIDADGEPVVNAQTTRRGGDDLHLEHVALYGAMAPHAGVLPVLDE